MKVRKAVIPAAGFGTRFLPATKAMPKEMLPIIDKPTIQYVVEEAIAAGLDDILIVTGRGKYAIEDHFDKSIELEHLLEKNKDFEKLEKISEIAEMVDIHYVRQKTPLGLPDAINVARKHVGDEPFAVLYGDDVHVPFPGAKPAIKQVIDCAEKYGASCFGVTATEEVEKYGVVKGKEVERGVLRIEDFIEKPTRQSAPTNLVNSGRNVFTPEFFDACSRTAVGKKGEKHIDAVTKEIMKKEKVYAKKLDARWYPVGDKFSFVKTTIDFALAHKEMRQEILDYIKQIAENESQ